MIRATIKIFADLIVFVVMHLISLPYVYNLEVLALASVGLLKASAGFLLDMLMI